MPFVLAGLRTSPVTGSFHGHFLVSTGFSSRGNTSWRDGKRELGLWLVWAVLDSYDEEPYGLSIRNAGVNEGTDLFPAKAP
jgi:hypothetical protein